MLLNLSFREKRKHPLALVVALSCLTSRLFHTAPHLYVGKLQTTKIDLDILLYSATAINYKTAEGVNMEVMQLHYTFLLCATLIMFLSLKVAPEAVFSARAAPSFSTSVVSERADGNMEDSHWAWSKYFIYHTFIYSSLQKYMKSTHCTKIVQEGKTCTAPANPPKGLGPGLHCPLWL